MKKVLFFLIILFTIPKVEAASYYSKYQEDYKYSDTEVEASDTVKVEKIDMYELYEEVITYEYLEESTFEPTGNTKIIETDWVKDINLIDQNKYTETYYAYDYYLAKNYGDIVIHNDNEFSIKLDLIRIYDRVTNDVIFYADNIMLNKNDKFYAGLDIYNLANLEIDIKVCSEIEGFTFKIYAQEEFSIFDLGDLLEDISVLENEMTYSQKDFSGYDIYPEDKKTASFVSDFLPVNVISYEAYYRNIYEVKEYKVINRNYLDEYALENKDGYLIDTEHVKTFYKYKTRDKVTIDDNSVITSKDMRLSDFIKESTINIDDILITSDINYLVNGTYKINFVLPFKTVTKDIKVKIEQNYIDLINKQTSYIKALNESYEKALYGVDKKNLEIKEVILEEETKVKELSELLNVCYSDKKSLEDQKITLKEESKIKQQSVSYIYILLLLILLLLVCRKKVIKKNS